MIVTIDKILRKIMPGPVYYFLAVLTGNIVFRFPGYKMIVIGVTGTNGKSTCAEIIANVLKDSGEKVGRISTVDIEIAGERKDNETGWTTIGKWGMHRLMREMVDKGCKYAVIEVSSEGICRHRILGIPFDCAVFTCLQPEHLNYHETMENYRNAKGRLFKKLSSPFNFKRTNRISVVNADDKEAEYFLNFKSDKKYSFGIDSRLRGNDNLVLAKNISPGFNGTEFEIVKGKKTYKVKTKVLGEFNVLNELAAFCVGMGYEIPAEKIIKTLNDFSGTKGRAERIDEGQDFQVIVDYAVTPDAQKALYKSLRKITKGRLISAFGATGDRDKTKRPVMGQVASELTDKVFLTDDETYTEDSKKIIDEVYAGVPEKLKSKVEVIPDRMDAIKKAIHFAKKGDTVAITGIGHQRARKMGGKKVEWNEREIVSDLLKKSLARKGE